MKRKALRYENLRNFLLGFVSDEHDQPGRTIESLVHEYAEISDRDLLLAIALEIDALLLENPFPTEQLSNTCNMRFRNTTIAIDWLKRLRELVAKEAERIRCSTEGLVMCRSVAGVGMRIIV
ncbi:MAG: hypothetical protein QOJ65_861 [Fimbriimonadaceae bacterium]|jgi:uncharacterized protein (DUF1697 family)|nr:hypothetical protein [Fimbriimonadaceae bacterium]